MAGSLGKHRSKSFVTELYKHRRNFQRGGELAVAGQVQAQAG